MDRTPLPDADAVGRIADDALALAAIPAPTGSERARGEAVLDRLLALHLDAAFDEAGSVVARIGEDGPALAVCAHLDTVFPAGTELAVRRDGDRLVGPGVGDNAVGIAVVLHLARTLALEPPPRPVLLAFTVGEEGLGDLRGVRALLDREDVRGLVAVEGHGVDVLAVGGIASLRYRVAATGPGGHSWTDRGAPSAVHALVGAAARALPAAGPVALNIGTIGGGTAVNAIAERAEMLLDLRHHDAAEVHAAGVRVRAALGADVPDGIELEVQEVGNRPGGVNRPDEPLVAAARAARADVGLEPADEHLASTDANAAHARGIPAVAVGITRGDHAHRMDEWVLVPPIAQGAGALVRLVATAP